MLGIGLVNDCVGSKIGKRRSISIQHGYHEQVILS